MKAEYFESVEVSDLGRKRKNNEDACLRIPDRGIYCVADGMGGQAGGDLASEAITTALQEVFAKAGTEEDGTLSQRIALFRKAANQASKWIKNFADEKVIGQMGSTLVALVIDPRNPARAVGLHAGDSRLYRFRKGELKLLTSDHSAVAALAVKLGRDPASIPAKYQNELLRCVGLSESVELEKTPVDVLSGDLFLICSDGLTRMLPDKTIAKILKRGAQNPISTVAQTLINGANEAGGKDNISVVLVKVGDISGVPNVIDPEEEEETKTLVAPASPSVAEAHTPLNHPGDSSGIPDTGDAYQGDTPRTDDLTPDKTPNPARPQKGLSDILGEKKEAKKNKTGKNKKIPPLGIAIVAAVLAAAGAGGWFIASSKQKTKPATVLAAATTTNKPSPIAPTTTIPLLQSSVTNKTDVQTQLDKAKEQNYQAAMTEGRGAFSGKDYAKAKAQVDVALEIRPGDPAATTLKNDVQKQLDLSAAEAMKAKEQEQNYQAAMKGGRGAFSGKDYAKAKAQADVALGIRPGDLEATQLARQTQEPLDLENARKFFDQDDYEAVAKLCKAYPVNTAFTHLAESNRVEQKALSDARDLFKNGDYSFTVRLKRQTYGRKAPFVELFNQATNEWKILGDLETLEQANNWQAVLEKLDDPAFAGFTNKPPFHALALQAANQKELAQLNVTFETMLVWFNIKSPTDSYIQTPEARKAKSVDGKIDEAQRDKYLKMLDQLENDYKKGGWLNQNSRAKYIKKLRDTITHHE